MESVLLFIYLIKYTSDWILVYDSKHRCNLLFDEDPQMKRQEVKDYLGMSEITDRREVKE